MRRRSSIGKPKSPDSKVHRSHAVSRTAHRQVSSLSAGEKQKLEILKLLYLKQRLLILDEPTSVLTPGEADEVLGLLGEMTRRGEVTADDQPQISRGKGVLRSSPCSGAAG